MKRKLYIFLGFFFIMFPVLLIMYLQTGSVRMVIYGIISILVVLIPVSVGIHLLEKSRWWIF